MKKLRFSFIKRIFKKKRNIAIGVVVLLILFFVFRPKASPMLDTIQVKNNSIVQSISVSGAVVAKKLVDLSFTTSGKLVFLGVAKGDSVYAGQTIAMEDARTVQKNLETALATYSQQRNTFEQTQDNNQNRTPQEALNDQMKRVLENNQYDLNKAVISVELQDLARQQSVLTSPIAGIVTRADAKNAGINITASTVFTVVDPSTLVFDMDVDEADIGKIAQGEKVKITLDAFPNNSFDSTIEAIDFASHITSTGGNAYTAQVRVSDISLPLRVGMNGTGEIILKERANIISVPISSIFDTDKVYILTKNGVEVRKVTLGIENDTDAEITSGISKDETVLTQPSQASKQSNGFLGGFFSGKK